MILPMWCHVVLVSQSRYDNHIALKVVFVTEARPFSQNLLRGEREKLLHMEEALARRVVGQDEAIRAVAEAVRQVNTRCSICTRTHLSD
jgi:ATP-dependent Clp protease ATP-binding subunit ClpB